MRGMPASRSFSSVRAHDFPRVNPFSVPTVWIVSELSQESVKRCIIHTIHDTRYTIQKKHEQQTDHAKLVTSYRSIDQVRR